MSAAVFFRTPFGSFEDTLRAIPAIDGTIDRPYPIKSPIHPPSTPNVATVPTRDAMCGTSAPTYSISCLAVCTIMSTIPAARFCEGSISRWRMNISGTNIPKIPRTRARNPSMSLIELAPNLSRSSGDSMPRVRRMIKFKKLSMPFF